MTKNDCICCLNALTTLFSMMSAVIVICCMKRYTNVIPIINITAHITIIAFIVNVLTSVILFFYITNDIIPASDNLVTFMTKGFIISNIILCITSFITLIYMAIIFSISFIMGMICANIISICGMTYFMYIVIQLLRYKDEVQ